jgi:hypothetical protein
MNLNELKKMIKEEWENFNEQAPPMPPTPPVGGPVGGPAPTVNVSGDDVDLMGGDENAESTLRDIYEMLKAYFEGGAGADVDADADMPDDMADTDVDDGAAEDTEDAEDDDEEEVSEDDKKSKKENKSKKELQERFQKLANIIK